MIDHAVLPGEDELVAVSSTEYALYAMLRVVRSSCPLSPCFCLLSLDVPWQAGEGTTFKLETFSKSK